MHSQDRAVPSLAQASKLAVAMMTFEYKLHSFMGLYATRVGTTA